MHILALAAVFWPGRWLRPGICEGGIRFEQLRNIILGWYCAYGCFHRIRSGGTGGILYNRPETEKES